MSNIVPNDELEQWAKVRGDDAGRLARELIAYRRAEKAANGQMKALEEIAAPRDCGCSPVCQCNSEESLRIEIDALKDIARAALASYRNREGNGNAL